MMRQFPIPGIVLLAVLLTLATGCRPQQPFYFFEDGDLSHYIGVATEVDYPDVEACSLDEVNGALPPLTLENSNPEDFWNLSLEEAMQIGLKNSKVMRNLGGIVFGATGSQGAPATLTSQPEFIPTIYGPAQQETDPSSRGGVEQALSAFDAQLSSSVLWEKGDRRNAFSFGQVFPLTSRSDTASFSAEISKTAATGGTWAIRHNVGYSLEKDQVRVFPSNWTTNIEAEFRQPLMQGAGLMYNRIAGPGAIPGFYNGVIIARLRTDQSLADFEVAVRDLVYDVERAYWELYYAYRSLEAAKAGRDAVLQLWRERKAEEDVGKGGRSEEAQARQQYFLFRSAAERAQSNLFRTENALRYILGIAATDGRLIRPGDEPTTADVDFDWYESHAEALTRSVELRKQKWAVKQREMELIASKNYILPRLDAVAQYRWLGLGDRLIDSDNSVDNAYGIMTSGDFQEWQIGLNLDLPIGFRKELAGIRHAQLNLARDRAVLQEAELEVSHQLASAYRDLDENYVVSQTNFNRRVAALDELDTVKSKYEYGQRDVTFAMVLDAQRRLAEAEIDYYRTVVDYNLEIANFHRRKGSLLEYNGVCLAEGPWPGKAYFDAHRLARARDASLYLDYGFTRPSVLSRGEYNQQAGGGPSLGDGMLSPSAEGPVEVIPTPDPLPMRNGASPTPAPGASGGGPELGGPKLSGGPAAGKAQVLDVGKLDLAPLATNKTAARPAAEGVQPASFVVPEAAAGQWKPASRASSNNEPVANHPPVKTDRTASGWKSVQH
jgi:outer membrane protein TolC